MNLNTDVELQTEGSAHVGEEKPVSENDGLSWGRLSRQASGKVVVNVWRGDVGRAGCAPFTWRKKADVQGVELLCRVKTETERM